MKQQQYRSTEEMLVESLRDDIARDHEYAATFAQTALDEALEVGDAAVFYLAVSDLARAMDVIPPRVAGAAGNAAAPDIVTLARALRALGLELKITGNSDVPPIAMSDSQIIGGKSVPESRKRS